ncbi:extracellular solute-binding protein [Paenibacillaceae bacterium]|nr:extracellular solute-binding protein [Paenibacillaceae bacterium]
MMTLLVTAMGVATIAGCSGGNKVNTPQEPNPAVQESGAPSKKTFTFLTYSNPSWPYSADWPVWDYLEEKTGVRMEVETPSGGVLADALSLTMASGKLPDLMFTQTKHLADKYGEQGALANVLDYVDEMPNFKAWMEKYPDAVQNTIASDGKMYVLPNQGIGETNRMIWMYREDVFKKHGLKQPATWDELYVTLQELKTLYPDSYPLAFRFGLRTLLNFGAAFNTPISMNSDVASVHYDEVAKEWRYGATEENFKTMLTYLNKFYAEKLIPPDFLTIDTKLWQDIMSTNRSFITLDYVGRIDFFNSALRKDNSEFNLAFMAPPAGPGGSQKNAFTQISEGSFMISSKSKNIKDIVKFMDFFYSEEGKTLASWGKEGETYATEGGVKKFIEDYQDVSDLRKKTGLATDGTYLWFDYDAHILLASPELQSAYEQAPNYDSVQQPKPAFTAAEQEILSTVGDVLNKNRDENVSKFILGNRSLSDWDKYVEEQNKLGVEQIVNIYKEAHDRLLNAAK